MGRSVGMNLRPKQPINVFSRHHIHVCHILFSFLELREKGAEVLRSAFEKADRSFGFETPGDARHVVLDGQV